ncbi:MAG: AbrB/MazE/SpoVT family DNA-binding domain-containing protein [Nitrososphaerota archaeon]|nr:AbrB/MazE/SpoVT family DNA-binding domain-containing protein [Nitrososphaerota archaeon]
MVRLQKRFAYKYKAKEGEKVHYKHMLTIPEDVVNRLGWIEGSEVSYTIEQDKLIVKAEVRNKSTVKS